MRYTGYKVALSRQKHTTAILSASGWSRYTGRISNRLVQIEASVSDCSDLNCRRSTVILRVAGSYPNLDTLTLQCLGDLGLTVSHCW